MAVLIPLENMVKILVSDSHPISDLIDWVDEQGLNIRHDYLYCGPHKGKHHFMFANPNIASLFKLTWGGL
jgi:hypothetical protein